MTLLSYLRQRLFCLLEVRYDRRWNIAVVFMALSKFMNFMKYLVSYPVNKSCFGKGNTNLQRYKYD